MVKEHLQVVARQYERLAAQASALSRRELSNRSPLDQIRSRVSLDLPAKTPTSFQNCLSKVRWEALCRAGSGLRRVRPHSRAALGWIGRLNIGAVCAHLSPTRNDDDAPIRGRLSNDTERLPPTSHDETGSRAGGMAGI